MDANEPMPGELAPVYAELSIESNGLVVLAGPLDMLALRGRAGHGELLTFLYCDPFDPDQPNERRPLRRARLMIEELGEL